MRLNEKMGGGSRETADGEIGAIVTTGTGDEEVMGTVRDPMEPGNMYEWRDVGKVYVS